MKSAVQKEPGVILSLRETGRSAPFSVGDQFTISTFGLWFGKVLVEDQVDGRWRICETLSAAGDANFDVFRESSRRRLLRLRFVRSRSKIALDWVKELCGDNYRTLRRQAPRVIAHAKSLHIDP